MILCTSIIRFFFSKFMHVYTHLFMIKNFRSSSIDLINDAISTVWMAIVNVRCGSHSNASHTYNVENSPITSVWHIMFTAKNVLNNFSFFIDVVILLLLLLLFVDVVVDFFFFVDDARVLNTVCLLCARTMIGKRKKKKA